MSVPNQTPYIIYNANGLTTVFPFEFYIINAGDIQVSLNGDVITTGYSVSGVGNVGGGDVTFLTPPANGTVVMLERVVPTYRLTDYQDNGDLLADTVNKDFDRLWMAIQRSFIYLGLALRRPLFGGPFNAEGYRISNLADPINQQDAVTKNYVDNVSLVRALRVPENYVNVLPAADQRANKLLAFNGAGNPITVLPPSGSASDVLIELAKPTGAELIGTGNGNTVQEELDFQSADYNRKIGKKHRKRVVSGWNWVFPDYTSLQATYSYTILIPQGFAIDDTRYYVSYSTNYAGGVNKWIWVAVYDRSTSAYISCFSIPNSDATSYCESLYVRINGAVKTIYTTADLKAVGYDLTSLPANKAAVTTKVFEYTNCAAFAPSPQGLTMFRTDTFDKMLVTVGWDSVVRGVALLPDSVHALAAKSSPYRQTRGKVQARTMFNGDLIMVGCARYDADDVNNSLTPLNAPFYIKANASGAVTDHYFYDPDYFLKTIDPTVGKTVLENEGVAVSPEGGLYSLWYTDGAGPTTIKIIEEFSVSENSIDFSFGLSNTLAGGIKDAKFVYYNTSWVNPYTNKRFSSVDDIYSMILQLDIRYPISFYTNAIFNVESSGAHKVPAGTLMTFQMMSDSTIHIDFVGSRYRNTAVSSVIGSYIFGVVQIGGAIGDSILTSDSVVLAPGGVGAIHTKRDTTLGALHYSFYNPNGSVGSIVTNGTGTAYNTTSDIELKVDNGEIADAIRIIEGIYENDGVRYAAYKNDPENVMPMYMAQNLYKQFPYAVTPGVGKPGDADYIPWSVDYSKITPVLIAAIYALSKR